MTILKSMELDMGKDLILAIAEGCYAIYIQQENSVIKDGITIPLPIIDEVLGVYDITDYDLNEMIEILKGHEKLLKS